MKSLESNGLVNRNVLVDEFPVVVEYLLTDYSDSLGEVLDALIKWGIDHRAKITGKNVVKEL